MGYEFWVYHTFAAVKRASSVTFDSIAHGGIKWIEYFQFSLGFYAFNLIIVTALCMHQEG